MGIRSPDRDQGSRITFRDLPRTIEVQPTRVRVSFIQHAAFYWLAPGKSSEVSALQRALNQRDSVEVGIDGSTLEILTVGPATVAK